MSELKTIEKIEKCPDCNAINKPKCIEYFCLIKEVIEWIEELENDFLDDTIKPLLKPRNNREYWLFTENRQRWMDKFNIKEEDLNARIKNY